MRKDSRLAHLLGRPVIGLAAVCVLVSCAPSSVQVQTNADEVQRATYTETQAKVYREYIFEHLEDTVPEDMRDYMTLDDVPMPSEAEWEPYEVRAKALCDDARTNGWAIATDAYVQQAYRDVANQMSGVLPSDQPSMTLEDSLPLITPFMEVQVAAVTQPGSLCPEVK